MNRKPKILIDARMVSPHEHGISKYVTAIAESLSMLGLQSLPYEPLFVLSPEMSALQGSVWTKHSTVVSPVPFLHPREMLALPRLLKREGASAFHSPSFASFPFLKVPYLQTVHDLIHLQFGSSAHRAYYRFLLRPFARRAKILATVSGAARSELAQWVPRELDEIRVHLNTFDDFASDERMIDQEQKWLRSFGLEPMGYFLSVANEKPHKNLNMLRAAHARSGARAKLVIGHEFMAMADPDRSHPFAISALIRNAKGVFSPSLAEGFGRVPVEALLLKTPVMISDIPSHREISEELGTGAHLTLLDPRVDDQWIEAFQNLDKAPRTVVPQAVPEKIRQIYSQSRLGPEIDSAYRKLLNL